MCCWQLLITWRIQEVAFVSEIECRHVADVNLSHKLDCRQQNVSALTVTETQATLHNIAAMRRNWYHSTNYTTTIHPRTTKAKYVTIMTIYLYMPRGNQQTNRQTQQRQQHLLQQNSCFQAGSDMTDLSCLTDKQTCWFQYFSSPLGTQWQY